jgi:hypothetical protein
MVRSLFAVFGIIAILGEAGQAQQSLPPHPRLPECQRNDPLLKLPDLVPEVPGAVRTISRGTYRDMQFTTSVGNIGPGPLILEGVTVSNADGVFTAGYQLINRRDGSQCAHPAGLFVYHPQHAHWHFDRFVAYELRSDDPFTGPLAVEGEKMSFCLLDIQPVRGFNPIQNQRQITTQTCSSAEGIVGISVGWEDVYERFLPGQSINLDPDIDHQVPVGSYFLVNKVNPDGKMWEANLDNNTSFAAVGVSLSPRVLTGPPGPTPTVGPAPNPQRPHLRPGRVRPTRVPRDRPGVQHTPEPARVPEPTRPRPVDPGPTRTRPVEPNPTPTTVQNTGSSGTHQPHTPGGANPPAPRDPRPTRAPRPRPGDPGPTPTPPRTDGAHPIAECENACPYDVSQLKLTWYDGAGLTFDGFVSGGPSGCEPLHPDTGATGSMLMVNWLNARGRNLDHDHTTTFTLGEGAVGATADGGELSMTQNSSGFRFTYTAQLPPPARTSDGFDGFPVSFDGCFTLGNEAVKLRLVCQGKSRGLLCHEG